MNTVTDIQTKIQAHLDENGQLPCEVAHRIAHQLGVDPLTVGEQTTVSDVRITRCQLGFFGYAAKKGMPGYKTVKKLTSVLPAAAAAVRQAAEGNQISCAALWEIGQAQGLSKSDMGNIAETLGLRVRPCQLGCF